MVKSGDAMCRDFESDEIRVFETSEKFVHLWPFILLFDLFQVFLVRRFQVRVVDLGLLKHFAVPHANEGRRCFIVLGADNMVPGGRAVEVVVGEI